MNLLIAWKPNCVAVGGGSNSSKIPGLAYATVLCVYIVVDFLLKVGCNNNQNHVGVFHIPQSPRASMGKSQTVFQAYVLHNEIAYINLIICNDNFYFHPHLYFHCTSLPIIFINVHTIPFFR